MSIGYASLVEGLNEIKFRSIKLNNVTNERLIEIITYNLNTLDKIIDYNITNNIKLFRISSDIIPFGSHKVNKLNWQDIFKEKLDIIANKIKNNKIRVSMHPGQYTVLNSLDNNVVNNAILDLTYHANFLKALKTDYSSKIILHVGGIYGNKQHAIERFVQNFKRLPEEVKKRLVIENDEKSYNILDVLNISKIISIPVIFDNLHHHLNKPEIDKEDSYWIELARNTFNNQDGLQKIHYSQQDINKRPGAHSNTINHKFFLEWYNNLETKNIDIMLEVKDKNLSAIKINNCLNENLKVSELELEWSKYKYLILERSPENYLKIRVLLKDKLNTNARLFYQYIEEAIDLPLNHKYQINVIEHIWGHFKNDEKLKKSYISKLDKFKNKIIKYEQFKNWLFKLAINKKDIYLINSYYFYF